MLRNCAAGGAGFPGAGLCQGSVRGIRPRPCVRGPDRRHAAPAAAPGALPRVRHRSRVQGAPDPDALPGMTRQPQQPLLHWRTAAISTNVAVLLLSLKRRKL